MISLRQIEYLIALKQTNHFGKAAELAGVSQPGLSMQIKTLEDSLGFSIIERRKKDVIFTEKGEEILAIGKQMIDQKQAIINLSKQQQQPLSGNLTLGAIPTIAPYIMPKILPFLSQKHPQLKLFLREEQTAHILENLNSGKLDVGIIALPSHDSRFKEKLLFTEDFFLALPDGSKLNKNKTIAPAIQKFSKKSQINVTDLNAEDLLLLEEGHCLSDQAIDICKAPKVQTNNAFYGANFRASSLETLKCMVSEGLGMTLLPSMTIKTNDSYKTIPFSAPVPQRQVGLIWRYSSPRSAEFELLAKSITDAYSE